ncbi:unnamed protein product (macronuclear) [Paramecium tetraurelia]|uniref:Protein kinase domain-containing protein n=1 Tax=Paramecium tetraurelia TaxID=5888 RepID=A0EC71_PARTE|nr:uncharacterized protein GSPATT00025624001 [Paramecium tetraurelia]CAK92888.1 unnamed protein product [Paramecium tetraurelia]|eukprot:XP_001460285.1 hypothetical protein (macronuclear) [Paramecium tetraurelia strain d4-2]
MHRRIGTPGFMAPQIFKTKQNDQQIDVFSLGVIFYYTVFGRMLFGTNFNEALSKNEQGEIEYPDYCKISISGLQLMKIMLLFEKTRKKDVPRFKLQIITGLQT